MRFQLLGFLVAVTAAAQKIEIEFNQNADFSHFRTFAIRDGKLNSKNPSLNSDLVRKRIDGDLQCTSRTKD